MSRDRTGLRGWVGWTALLAAFCCQGALAGGVPAPPPPRPSVFPDLPKPPEVPVPFAEPRGMPEGRKIHLPALAAEATARGLPPEIADAVAWIESGYSPGAIGADGERGMMQVMPPTAAMLGFRGTPAELAEPAVNIRLGVRYLADAWKLADGNLCRALMKYRAGHNQERMSALSVEYCRRAKSHLAAIGSPLAAGPLPAVEFGALPAGLGPTSAGTFANGAAVKRVAGRTRRVGPTRTVSTSRRFWTAHTARIRAIEARLPWRRGGIMAGT